jgi:hypothetical protein
MWAMRVTRCGPAGKIRRRLDTNSVARLDQIGDFD